jgi:cytochrome P450
LLKDAVEGQTQRPQAARTRADLPGPRGWPLLGNAPQIDVKRFHLQLAEWAQRYGPVYRYDLGPIPFVVTTEATMINDAFRRRPEDFRRISTFETIFSELGVDGVFSAEGRAWRAQRKLAVGALNPRHLQAFFPTLRQVAENLLRRWERAASEQRVLDLQTEMMRFTIDVTTRLAFSEAVDTLTDRNSALLDQLSPLFPVLAYRINAAFPYWRYFKLPADRAVDRGLAQVREWLSELIEKTRAELAANPERTARPTNFLEAMLVERDENGEPFSDELVFANAITMLLAGEDTTANTVSWAVHLLLDADEPRCKLVEQVDAVLGVDHLPADIETCKHIDYCEAVAHETMRLKPVAPVLFLECNDDVVLGDIGLKKGTAIALLTRLPAMDSGQIDAPDAFRPERWADRGLVSRLQKSGVFTPFGSGPRICPGRSLALLEMRVVLATFYRNFTVERIGRAEEVREVFGFTMNPEGLRVKLRPR